MEIIFEKSVILTYNSVGMKCYNSTAKQKTSRNKRSNKRYSFLVGIYDYINDFSFLFQIKIIKLDRI